MSARVGVDLGATHVRAAVVTGDGATTDPIRRKHAREDARAMAALVASVAREAAGGAELGSLGLGFPGWVVPGEGHVLNGPNLGWRDEPFGALLRDALPGTRVAVVNDLKAIAWGESRFGAARGAKVAGVVFVGSGIGSAVVSRGQLQEGASGLAGEIGHVRVIIDGAQCGCGGRGCLEAYVGGANIDRRLRELVTAGRSPRLLAKAGGDVGAVHVGLADEAVREGDPEVATIWREVGELLGLALAGYVTVHDPDRLVLGGGVWASCDALRDIAERRLRLSLLPPSLERLRIVAPELGDRAGILGAADLSARLEG